jgi:hypothetical protein
MIYFGDKTINEVYYGSQLVYRNPAPPSPVPPSLVEGLLTYGNNQGLIVTKEKNLFKTTTVDGWTQVNDSIFNGKTEKAYVENKQNGGGCYVITTDGNAYYSNDTFLSYSQITGITGCAMMSTNTEGGVHAQGSSRWAVAVTKTGDLYEIVDGAATKVTTSGLAANTAWAKCFVAGNSGISNRFSGYAIDKNGNLWVTGRDTYHQLGIGTLGDQANWVKTSLVNIKIVFALGGSYNTSAAWAIDSNNDIWITGDKFTQTSWTKITVTGIAGNAWFAVGGTTGSDTQQYNNSIYIVTKDGNIWFSSGGDYNSSWTKFGAPTNLTNGHCVALVARPTDDQAMILALDDAGRVYGTDGPTNWWLVPNSATFTNGTVAKIYRNGSHAWSGDTIKGWLIDTAGNLYYFSKTSGNFNATDTFTKSAVTALNGKL